MKFLISLRIFFTVSYLFFFILDSFSFEEFANLKKIELKNYYNHGVLSLQNDLKMTYFSTRVDDKYEGIILDDKQGYGQIILEGFNKGLSHIGVCLRPIYKMNKGRQIKVTFINENLPQRTNISPVYYGDYYKKNDFCNGFFYEIKKLKIFGKIKIKIENISYEKIIIESIFFSKMRVSKSLSFNNRRESIRERLPKDKKSSVKLIDIEQAKKTTNNDLVVIKGIVTGRFQKPDHYYIYLQDMTSGIAIDMKNKEVGEWLGKTLFVEGIKKNYYGLPIIVPNNSKESILMMDTNESLMEVNKEKLNLNNINYNSKGHLIEIHDLTVKGPIDKYGYFIVKDIDGNEIFVKDVDHLKWRVGTRIKKLVGILGFSYGKYRIYPRDIYDYFFDENKTYSNSYLWSFPSFYGITAGESIKLKTVNGHDIFYTLDGSDPIKNGKLYQENIIFSPPKMMIRAISCLKNKCYPEKKFGYFNRQSNNLLSIEDLQKVPFTNEIYPHFSLYNNTMVHNLRGIVTYIKMQNGFFIQSINHYSCDNSNGIFIKIRETRGLKEGDEVLVSGLVAEINAEKRESDLTQTNILASEVVKTGENYGNISYLRWGKTGCSFPMNHINKDLFSFFNPHEDGIDFYKSMQSRIVALRNPLVVGPSDKYGGFYVILSTLPHKIRTERNGILISPTYENPEIFYIKTKEKHTLNVGDAFKGDIEGIVTYNAGIYHIMATKKLPEVEKNVYEYQQTLLKKDKTELTVASYNIENYCAKNNQLKTRQLARQIVRSLRSPDIVSLQEVMDNDCAEKSEVVSGTKNLDALIKAIEREGGPLYHHIEINPVVNSEGGIPGGNIRVGILYNKDIVQMTSKKEGNNQTNTNVSEDGISHNPGRVDPFNQAFKSSRRSLVVEFLFKNKKIYVINNHLNSKWGDDSVYGRRWPLYKSSEFRRTKQVKSIVNFAEKIIDMNPEASVIILGDMNDFQFSKVFDVMNSKKSYFFNTTYSIPQTKRYSYVYRGNSQMLDHIFLSKKLLDHYKVDVIHLNSDYNYETRVSDHDPVMVKLKM